MAEFARGLGIFALLVATAGFWAFILLYHVLADWRKSQMGIHVMSFMGSCAATLTWSWIGLMFPVPEVVRLWVRVLLWGSVALVVWWRVRILIRGQILARGSAPDVLEGNQDAP